MSERITQLASGLTIATDHVPAARSVAIGVWVAVGSRDEPAELSGVSHFLEHLLFKGTDTRSATDISRAVDRVGGDINAFTSKEYTAYYARVRDRDLPMAVDLGWLARPGIVTRYHILRPDTPASGHGANGANPGKATRGSPGKTAQATPANGHGAPRQNSTPHPGKSCTEPRQNLHPTPANQRPEPLSEPSREPKTRADARKAEDVKTRNFKEAPPQPVGSYEPVEVAREEFQRRLDEMRRRAHPEDYEEPDKPGPTVGPERAKRVAMALKFSLQKKYGPEEKNPTAEQGRGQQLAKLAAADSPELTRLHFVEPEMTPEEQLARLHRMMAEEAAAKAMTLEAVARAQERRRQAWGFLRKRETS